VSKLDQIERRIDFSGYDLEEYVDDLDWLIERARKLETALTEIQEGCDSRKWRDLARDALKED